MARRSDRENSHRREQHAEPSTKRRRTFARLPPSREFQPQPNLGGPLAASRLRAQPSPVRAAQYIRDMKIVFDGQPGVHRQFFMILKMFREKSIKVDQVMHAVADLFVHYDRFLYGFEAVRARARVCVCVVYVIGYVVRVKSVAHSSPPPPSTHTHTHTQFLPVHFSMHKLMQERRDAATKHNEAVAIRAAEQAVLNQQHGVGAVGSTAGGAAAPGSAGELAGTELTSARSYIHRVQAVLEKTQKTHAYRTFLRIILEASRAVALQDCLDVITVWNEVKVILHGHPDLLEEFKDYLPPGSTPVIERHEKKLAIELRREAAALAAQAVLRERERQQEEIMQQTAIMQQQHAASQMLKRQQLLLQQQLQSQAGGSAATGGLSVETAAVAVAAVANAVTSAATASTTTPISAAAAAQNVE